jgi:hypothetical protein
MGMTIAGIESHGRKDRIARRPTLPQSLAAHSVAGGGWLFSGEQTRAVWVNVEAYRIEAPHEVGRIARLARALILARDGDSASLCPVEVNWLLRAPRRLACLIDFLAASEDPVSVLTAPLEITFTPLGNVRWRLSARRGSPRPTDRVCFDRRPRRRAARHDA